MVGSGGANDIASCAKKTILIMRQEERKFRETISFVTSPGFVSGGDSRKKAGLAGGPGRVITDKAIYGFHPETKKMVLISIHPGNTLEDVISTLGLSPYSSAHGLLYGAAHSRATATDPGSNRPRKDVHGIDRIGEELACRYAITGEMLDTHLFFVSSRQNRWVSTLWP